MPFSAYRSVAWQYGDTGWVAMHHLTEADARERLWWLDPAPVLTTGYAAEGWADSVWVLHAMYERDDIPADLTRETVRQTRLASGGGGPLSINGVELDEDGFPLDYTTPPGPPWQRLRWAEWAAREGVVLGAGWDVPPCLRWLDLLNRPVRYDGPEEGSLDEPTLDVLIQVLVRHTKAEALQDCSAFFNCFAALSSPARPTDSLDAVTVYAGSIHDVPELAAELDFSPSNLWPADRSWLLYTDWDLTATRVSGSRELIAAIEADRDIETLQWQRSSAP